jgi:hypothetical protein
MSHLESLEIENKGPEEKYRCNYNKVLDFVSMINADLAQSNQDRDYHC